MGMKPTHGFNGVARLLPGVRKIVFWPSFLLLMVAVLFSFIDVERFLAVMTNINQWILSNFDGLFSYSTLSLLITLLIVYCSPLGLVTIGGQKAQPLLTKWRWFSITLCTTLATGILFWAAAEPMYHLYSPPESLDLIAGSVTAQEFTMATLFMHWSFSPYAIYCVPSLVFALCYYNLNSSFTIGSTLAPAIGKSAVALGGNIIDSIALFALVAGMASSLGTGILSLSGGIEATMGIANGKLLMAVVAAVIVLTFVVSAISGLQKGIARLSNVNAQVFVALCLFVLVFGPTEFILANGVSGLLEYGGSFLERSTNTLTGPNDEWPRAWTVFYFANWYAWAPIAALFLGRIAKGYTVRQFINVNLIFPACFAILWMSVFAGAAIHYDALLEGAFRQSLLKNGPESVIYMLFDNLPLASFMTIALIGMIFISFVTAADSNTDAMSRLCTQSDRVKKESNRTSIKLKLIWGMTIGVIAWVMVSFASIDGIRLLTSLGGLPALFIIMLANLSLILLIKRAVQGADFEPD